MLKMRQIFPKLYSCLLYLVFHNLEPQNAGFVDVKRDLHLKRSKGLFVRKNLKKISIVIKNVIWSEKTLIQKQSILAIIFSNSFTHNQVEQIKKGVICVQILLEIHLTEHGRFHFQGRIIFYTPVLVTSSRNSATSFQCHAPAGQ